MLNKNNVIYTMFIYTYIIYFAGIAMYRLLSKLGYLLLFAGDYNYI